MFYIDQKKISTELNNGGKSQVMYLMLRIVGGFGVISGRPKSNIIEAQWLKELKNENMVENQQELVEISPENGTKQCRKIPNWKVPGKDGVLGYSTKSLSSLHKRIACQLNKILEGADTLPTWMTYGRTVLCQKDPAKDS